MTDGQVIFEIEVDGKHAISDVREVSKTIETEARKWESDSKQATQGMESGFTSMFAKIGAAAAAAKVGKALLDWGKAAVSAASDLQEVQNVVDTTFGDGAAQIERWAKNAGQQFGLTETQAKRFTSTLGAMMKSAGMSDDDIVEMSTDLAGLAADMASFYNLDFDTAFQKIRSGISGETEPLKQLGVNMSVANLEAFALGKGITKAFNAMSQSEQTVLRYQYLMKATADAQGDFARTADGYANSSRRIETALETLKTNVGTYLLEGVLGPAQSALADFLEKITQTPSRTVMDDFNEIELNTAAKIEEINKTMEQASALVDVLDNISSKSGSVAPAVQQIATDLGNIDFNKSKGEVLNQFLGVLNQNIDAISAVTGMSAEGAQEWVNSIAQSASELDWEDATAWEEWVNTVFAVLPGLADTDAGKQLLETLTGIQDTRAGAKLDELAQEIGKIDPNKGGKKAAIQTFLETLYNSIDDISEITGKSPEEVKAWLDQVAGAANDLDENSASGWADLVAAINQGFPELSGVAEWQALSAALLGISNSKADENLKRMAEEIGKIDPETGGKKSALNQFIETLKGNIETISELTGKSPEEVQNWLTEISNSANNLSEDSAAGWGELVAAINEGFPQLTGITEWQELSAALLGISGSDAGSKLQSLAQQIGQINPEADKKSAVNQFLETLKGNLDDIAEITGKSPEEVKAWLEQVSNAANNLDNDSATGWADFVAAVNQGFPELTGVAEWQALSSALLGISESTADQDLNRIAQEIGRINPEGGKKALINEFLETMKGNLDAISTLTGKTPDEIKAWLNDVSNAANNLDENSAEGWGELVDAINKGFPQLTGVTEWQELAGALTSISNTGAAGSIEGIANKLNDINLEQGKAGILKETLSTLRNDAEALAKLTGQNADGVIEFLNRIEEKASGLSEDDVAGWNVIAQMLKDGIPQLEETEGGKSVIEALTDQVGALGDKGSYADQYLEELGIDSGNIANKQKLWLETCKRLVQVLPGLSSIINTETGEVKGGVQAIKDYLTEWGNLEKKRAMYAEIEEKESALSEAKNELPSYQMDVMTAEQMLKNRNAKIKELADKYGLGREFERLGVTGIYDDLLMKASPEDAALFRQLIGGYYTLGENIQTANDELDRQNKAIETAEENVQATKDAYEGLYGAIEDADDAADDFWRDEKVKEAAKASVQSVQEATTALADYVADVRDATAQAVDSAVHGFEKIESAESKMANNKNLEKYKNRLQELGARTEENAKEWDELNKKINDLNGKTIITPKEMLEGLASQLAFMREYKKNLQLARDMGLSNELIASLSDGSVESAEYLAALVSDRTGIAGQIDEMYRLVQEEKEGLTTALTDQKLTVDETYDAMAAKAKEAVASMALFSEAEDAAGQTVAGLAQGIQDHVPDVEAAVDAIEKELDRLNGWGINIDFGTFGSINISLGKELDGEHAAGLDWVPFDGYLASLHEGEGILTAEENRIWQRFKNGYSTNGVDYDALGGVMRDNVHAGGNVYLDGRTVGQVVSGIQGQSYRTLQRSGWQS